MLENGSKQPHFERIWRIANGLQMAPSKPVRLTSRMRSGSGRKAGNPGFFARPRLFSSFVYNICAILKAACRALPGKQEEILMGKRYLIAVDLEGAACVVGTPFTSLNGSSNYAFACRQATREADAAARALFDGGAEEVIVWDNHGQGVNLDYEQLDPRCRILLGTGYRSRFPLPEGRYDGLILIGYHGREGTPGGVLAHSYNSVSFQGHTVNGEPLGEMQIDAAFAGKRGVPVLFAASDDQAIAQARESFPWIETVVTKQASAWNFALSLHPQAAVEAIYRGVTAALAREAEMQVYTIREPLHLSLRFRRADEAAAAKLYDRARRPFASPDAYTREGWLDQLEDLFN